MAVSLLLTLMLPLNRSNNLPVVAHTINPPHALNEGPAGMQAMAVSLACLRLNASASSAGKNRNYGSNGFDKIKPWLVKNLIPSSSNGV
jgi:hypothetical protein